VTVCEWFGVKTTPTVFACLTSKPVVMVSGGLTLKPAATVSGSLASKPAATVSGGLTSKPAVTVFFGLASKPVAMSFLVEPQNQGGGRFSDLDFKTGSYDLVICASKSPRRFLDLSLKTKQVLVCRLCHKTDGGRSARDTRRDLAACFVWKQVGLGFLSLA
jgi:hypothetical protein